METCFTATYRVRSDSAAKEIAEFLATMETTGPWARPGPPTSLFQQCRGFVGEVCGLQDGSSEITIQFPVRNINLVEPFQGLWLSITSGYAPAALHFEARLVGITLPPELLNALPGPRFGMKGIRQHLGVPDGKLLIGTIVKPVSGLTPEEVALDVYEAAVAGVQFIKDDQKMLNPPYCPLERRVEAVRRALDQVQAETGRRVLYAPNLASGGKRLIQEALAAVNAGAEALLVTFMSTGLEALAELARDSRVKVPLYGHCGGKELMTRAPHFGIDESVLGTLVRLMGGT